MEVSIESEKLPAAVPLSVFEKHYIGSAQNNGEVFDVYLGLDAGLVSQLRELSLSTDDVALQEQTSDFQRFGQERYETWYAQGRVPFALVHKSTGSLAALIWFGPKPLGQKSLRHLSPKEHQRQHLVDPEHWHTVAFRSYPPFRGTGIMRRFAEAVTVIYQKYYPDAQLWTSNSRTNAASIALSEKLGYTTDESASDETTVTMVKKILH